MRPAADGLNPGGDVKRLGLSLGWLPSLDMLGLCDERLAKRDDELEDDAMEFGGFRLPDDSKVTTEPSGLPKDFNFAFSELGKLSLFLCAASFTFSDSGIPSHFEFTLGTVGGSFCIETPGIPTAPTFPPFSVACFRCFSANCSSADCDGSLRVRKPNIELPFFFFWPFVGVPWHASCVRLGEIELRRLGMVGGLLEVEGALDKEAASSVLLKDAKVPSSLFFGSPLEEVDIEA